MVLRLEEKLSLADFERYIAQNPEKHAEFIGGKIVEFHPHAPTSIIVSRLLTQVGLFVETQQLGYLFGADGGYAVGSERYFPKFSFLSWEHHPHLPYETFISHAPDLALETSTTSGRNLSVKVSHYLMAGTTVWLVYPNERELHVHRPNQAVRVYLAKDTLISEGVLEGFTLQLADIFAEDEA